MNTPEYSILYAKEAIEDLREINSYYKKINPSLSIRFKEALLIAETEILNNPFAWSKVNFRDFRRIVINKFPHKIIFRVEKDLVHVFCVLHFARSNRYMKTRLKK